MLNIKWTIFLPHRETGSNLDLQIYHNTLLGSASKHSALISNHNRNHNVLQQVDGEQVWRDQQGLCFRCLGSVPSQQYQSVRVHTFMVIFFTRGFTSVKNTPPPQLCVRQVGRVWRIMILIRLRSTGTSADIV